MFKLVQEVRNSIRGVNLLLCRHENHHCFRAVHLEIPDMIVDELAPQADCLEANSENKFQVFPLGANHPSAPIS